MENNCPNHGETNLKISNIQANIDTCNADVREVVRVVAEIKQNIAIANASMKSYHKRLDEEGERIKTLEKSNQEVIMLANSIDRLAESIAANNVILNEHKGIIESLDDRLYAVENAPGKYALKMWQIVAGLILTGAVGFLLAHFGMGG